MRDYSTGTNILNVDNIFNNNRLGLSDSLESGRSLTVGVEYRKEMSYQEKDNKEDENLDAINKYFEFKLATVLRDKEEKLIPKKSTINKKQSNLFGSISNNISDKIDLNYNFAIDNDFNKFEHNDLNAKFTLNNLVTKFHFIETNGEMGDDNVFETNINYALDESNYIGFKTRRNRKLNLTEYYDLVYEYKNDCLTAGIKYNKTYYQDNDIEPEENLLFTITLFPLTTYEYEADELVTGELFDNLKN
jgi:LPS-assembly protein